jgi:hypothetical protein
LIGGQTRQLLAAREREIWTHLRRLRGGQEVLYSQSQRCCTHRAILTETSVTILTWSSISESCRPLWGGVAEADPGPTLLPYYSSIQVYRRHQVFRCYIKDHCWTLNGCQGVPRRRGTFQVGSSSAYRKLAAVRASRCVYTCRGGAEQSIRSYVYINKAVECTAPNGTTTRRLY